MAQAAESLSVNHLMTQGRVWRASRNEQAIHKPVASTGFDELNGLLPGYGWPKGELTELLYAHEGAGELSLLLPLLQQLSASQSSAQGAAKQQKSSLLALWVDPPHIPFAPSLERAGVDVSRMKVVRSQRFSDRLWALEQALKSGACQVVIGWLPKGNEKAIRRLQVAAQEGQCHGFLLRPAGAVNDSSPAPNRLLLSSKRVPNQQGVWLDVIKRRGGWPSQDHHIPFSFAQLLSAPLSARS